MVTSRRRYVRFVVVLGALISLGPLTVDMYLPAFPSLAAELGAGDAAVQTTLTGMLLGLGVGQLVVGPLSDALGRRRPLLVGIGLHAAASVLCAVAPDVVSLSAVRVLQGFAGAAVVVTAMAVVRDLFSGIAAARMLSRLMLVMGAAPILAPTLGGIVLEWTSWRGIFVVLALMAAALVALAWFGLPETLPVERRRSARPRATARTYASLLRDRTFVALVLIAGLVMSAMFAYISGSSFVLQGIYGLSEQTYGLVFGINAVGIIGFTQINPLLLRRYRPSQVLTFAVSMEVVLGTVLVVTTVTGFGGLAGLLIPLASMIAFVGLALPNTPALALSRHGEAAGTASAMLGSVQFGVGSVVAPTVGMLGSESAVPMGAVMLGVSVLAALLLFLVVRRDPRLETPS
ncbi:MAG: Bcr/CflA family multidrug efflux MFS transporter [Propionibacteriales bacterium]|nr:Bcr/CflA family multidrug efflux MFS transporter [Propionibacteriales bacterium]